MTNAKEEFIDTVGGHKIKCASILRYGQDYKLKTNHSQDAYSTFIDSLDFVYDSGYGGQELYGTIWCEDGTWFERGEYDGSEWWDYHKLPDIPQELK